jgi:hypothetical protein
MAEKRFFRDVPRGQRGGGTLHAAILGFLADRWRRDGCFCIIDLGEDPGKKLPDILVYPLSKKAGRRTVHPKLWDTPHRFAIEVETEPAKHPERVISNWQKCKAWGMPVIFAAPKFEAARKIVEVLHSQGATVVADAPSEYAPGVATVLFVHSESGTHVAILDPNQPPPYEASEHEFYAKNGETLRHVHSSSKAEPSVEEEAAEQPLALRPADRKSLISAFKDWHLTARESKAGKLLFAQKKVDGRTVTVHLGRLDDETENIIGELKLKFSEESVEPSPTKRKEAAPQPQHVKAEKTGTQSFILKFADWSLRVKRVKGKPYLTARKTVDGKRTEKSLGVLNDETKRIIEKLGLKVKGLNA